MASRVIFIGGFGVLAITVSIILFVNQAKFIMGAPWCCGGGFLYICLFAELLKGAQKNEK